MGVDVSLLPSRTEPGVELPIRLGEHGLAQLQRARFVHPPGTQQIVGHAETDVGALVIGEVEVELAQAIGQPLGRADQ